MRTWGLSSLLSILFIGTILFLPADNESSEPSLSAFWISSYPEPTALFDYELQPFYHGVAAGDPLQDGFIIWTRVTPDTVGPVDVYWEVSIKDDFTVLAATGSFATDASRDYTVKVDVKGLQAGRQYAYRFRANNRWSLTGYARTLPDKQPDQIKLAIATCANYEGGYYNAYERIAEQELDAVVHLGDYIYEYGTGHYGQEELLENGRKHLPETEIYSLADYRQRYSQYRTDSMLRKAHQQHAFIPIWDDHETANDSYQGGAENHQIEEEGDWELRKQHAQQAYFEWMPIREQEGGHIYRAFDFGGMVHLMMVDTRIVGRSQQVANSQAEDYRDTARTLLGKPQADWLTTQMQKPTHWRVIGNQVMVSPMDISFMRFMGMRIPWYSGRTRNMDQWDGYPAARNRVFDIIENQQLSNVVFLTGDDHASYGYEVVREENFERYGLDTTIRPLAVELVTPSISSANFDEYLPDFLLRKFKRAYPRHNPHLKWFDLTRHGYIFLNCTPQQIDVEWRYVPTITEPAKGLQPPVKWVIPSGNARLLPNGEDAAAFTLAMDGAEEV
ncbi:MAG: alkaline phosphatase D family protein [Bacteroidota bacterium]